MKLYDIKHNGYTFGQKKGKKEAVNALARHLAFEGILPDRQNWKNEKDGTITVNKDQNEYFSIEENNGG